MRTCPWSACRRRSVDCRQPPSGLTIRPVNYVVRERELIIRTDPAGSIAVLADSDQEVAFEVDYHNSTSGYGWTVGSPADEAAIAWLPIMP